MVGTRRATWFDAANAVGLFGFALLTLYPIWYTAALSVTAPDLTALVRVSLIPIRPTLVGYETLLSGNSTLVRAYANTIYYSAVGTAIALAVGAMAAYALSYRKLWGRKVVTIYLAISMFYSGGLIPTYLLVRGLALTDTVWALALPTAVSAWHIILLRTNFQALPESLIESAYLDGAQQWTILLRIVLPLSKAILATIGVFTVVTHWNSFFAPLLYLDSPEKWPLQVVLRHIIWDRGLEQFDAAIHETMEQTMMRSLWGFREVLKSAAIIMSIGPIILVYPFAQRYFVRGTLVGSIKG